MKPWRLVLDERRCRIRTEKQSKLDENLCICYFGEMMELYASSTLEKGQGAGITPKNLSVFWQCFVEFLSLHSEFNIRLYAALLAASRLISLHRQGNTCALHASVVYADGSGTHVIIRLAW